MVALKIVPWDGKKKVGVVADTVEKLIWKVVSTLKLENPENVTLVLASDGTLLVDDEYLQTLPKDTLLMVLKPGQKWSDSAYRTSQDQTDACFEDPNHLLSRLCMDPSQIILLNDIQLEMIGDLDIDATDSSNKAVCEQVQETCQRLLAERRDSRDACELMRMLTKK